MEVVRRSHRIGVAVVTAASLAFGNVICFHETAIPLLQFDKYSPVPGCYVPLA